MSKVDPTPRCWKCRDLLTAGYFTRPWMIRCERCKRWNGQPLEDIPEGLIPFLEAQLAKAKAAVLIG